MPLRIRSRWRKRSEPFTASAEMDRKQPLRGLAAFLLALAFLLAGSCRFRGPAGCSRGFRMQAWRPGFQGRCWSRVRLGHIGQVRQGVVADDAVQVDELVARRAGTYERFSHE